MPLITDWISSIASLVGGVAGIGALVVAILSYLRSSRALATDQDVVQSASATLSAVEALAKSIPDGEAQSSRPGPTATSEEHEATHVGEEHEVRHVGEGDEARHAGEESYASAIREAHERLDTAKSRIMMVTCPHCGKRLGPFTRVTPGLVKCGACGRSFRVR